MSLISNLLGQTVAVYSVVEDGYGDETKTLVYSAMPCRFQNKIEKVIGKTGDEEVSRAQLWYETTYTININYQIYYESEYYIIVSKEAKIDLDGNIDFHKIFLR